MVFLGALTLLAFAALWAIFPRILAVPVVVVLGWIGLSLLWKAWRLRKPAQTTSPASLATSLDERTAISPSATTGAAPPLPTDAPS